MSCKGPNCTASKANGYNHSSECLFEYAANRASGVVSASCGVELPDDIDHVVWRGKVIDLASPPAAPGVDLEQFHDAVLAQHASVIDSWCGDPETKEFADSQRDRLLALIDASPKGGIHPDDAAVDAFAAEMKAKLAKAREKGRGGWQGDEPGMQQRLSDMLREHVEKGDPRDVANFCMFLHQRGEGVSPKGGSDALARAYGYLWHVNHPEDIPTGHPYMSADRAAVEARKELRDMLTHEQRGEGINWVRQKLLAAMQATSAEVGS